VTLAAPEHLRGSMHNAPVDLFHARNDWISDVARKGHGVSEIAAALGITTKTVHMVFRALGVSTAKQDAQSPRQARAEIALAFIAAHPGCRRSDVVAAVGMSDSTISDVLQSLVASGRAHRVDRYKYFPGPEPKEPTRAAKQARAGVRVTLVPCITTTSMNSSVKPVSVRAEPWSDGAPRRLEREPMPGRTIRADGDWRSHDRLLRNIEKGAFQKPRQPNLGAWE